MSHENHPSLAQLTAFDQGELAAVDWDHVESHLAACTACCERLETVADGQLVQRLRSAARATRESSAVRAHVAVAESPHAPTAEEIPAELRQHRRYRIVEVLGAGGMGTVYRAEHALMARSVALKVLSPRLTRRPELVERFRQEVQAAARLSHPNIVTAFDAEEAGPLQILVMEFVPGRRVDTLLADGPLPIAAACDIARQVALGLEHAAERGMVHRDIKPQNLMRLPDGRVKILDFGLARFASENLSVEALTQSGMVLGTPDYIAPEQARDPRTADIRADLYSLGCTLYFLLTGQPPFPGGSILQKLLAHEDQTPRSVRALRPEVPPALEQLVNRLLAKQPAARFATPADVARALTPFALGQAEEAPSAAAQRQRLAVWLSVGAALLLTTLLLGAVGLHLLVRVDPEPAPTAEAIRRAAIDAHAAAVLVGHQEPVIQIAASPDGHHAASVGSEPDVFVWNLATQQLEYRLGGHHDQVRSVAYSRDGTRLLTGSADGRLGLWDAVHGQNLKFLSGQNEIVQAVALAPSGEKAASGGYDNAIRVWQLSDGTIETTLTGHTAPVTGVAFEPDGKRLVSVAQDGLLVRWNLETGKAEQSQRHEHALMALALSHSGRYALAGCYNHKIYLWDLAKQECLREFVGHTEPVLAVSLSPDSRYVLSAAKDGTVRLWEAVTGTEIDTFRGHTGESLAVSFDVTGRRALSGDQMGGLLLWTLPIPEVPTALSLDP